MNREEKKAEIKRVREALNESGLLKYRDGKYPVEFEQTGAEIAVRINDIAATEQVAAIFAAWEFIPKTAGGLVVSSAGGWDTYRV